MPGAPPMLDAEFYRKQCARLREESEELLETVRQLRIERDAYAQMCDTPMRRAVEVLGISPYAAKVLCRLMDAAPKAVAVECLMTHVGSASPNAIKVYVARTRAALRGLECHARLRSIYGFGYYITEADAQEVRILLDLPQTGNEQYGNLSAILNAQNSTQEKQRAVG